jgi:RNA-splicing ligase RtcB
MPDVHLGKGALDEVMNQQQDLVEVVATLKQVVCVKG